ncbi:MAG: hypothetical protein QME12_02885 [Nanoarchaeota archaeon]|nr:hypothetical protein [Nanoarchaeota archaeon]
MKVIIFAFIFLPIAAIFVSAWNGVTHAYLCPEDHEIDCNAADSHDFQRSNPYASTLYHVCYDNKENCMSRLAAKYFLKKYYGGGDEDKQLLAAAAHLFQDSACPLHWYPGFEMFGREIYISAPKAALSIEGETGRHLSSWEKPWNIPIRFKGETIDINSDYVNNLKSETSVFLSKEPEESLEEINAMLKSKAVWHRLRAYRDFVIILLIISIPILGYQVWQYRRKKIHVGEMAAMLAFQLILIIWLVMVSFFY